MKFSCDACNLSLTNEVKFIEKYVIDECEKMISELEGLFNNNKFIFKDRKGKKYSVDKSGHVLVDFQGEKISGALDFIVKILEFDKIFSINKFIQRIEECNRKIQPILIEEAKILEIKIKNLEIEINEIQPKYDIIFSENNKYKYKRNMLQSEMIVKGEISEDLSNIHKLDSEFILRFPEYNKFKKEFDIIFENYRIINQ